MKSWLNEQRVDTPSLSLMHGHGIYETLLWRGGPPPAFLHHIERLNRGAACLQIAPPADGAVLRSVQATGIPSVLLARVRIVLWQGKVGGPGVHLVQWRPATEAECRPAPARLLLGPKIRTIESPFFGCKHLGIASDLALRQRAARQGCDEVLLRSTEGWLSEAATAAVVFGMNDGTVGTPALEAAPLPSTTLALAEARGIGLEPLLITEADLPRISWILLSNAVIGARAVAQVQGQVLQAPPAQWLSRLRACTGLAD